jgi:hypothetical protein
MAPSGIAVLLLNSVWFSLAFHLFALRPSAAVRMLVTEDTRHESSRAALVAALPFLGGMNLAFAALSLLSLVAVARGSLDSNIWLVFAASAIAHASQLAGNVPLALAGGRAGGAPWNVLKGPMRFIFVVDGMAAVANLVACGWVMWG